MCLKQQRLSERVPLGTSCASYCEAVQNDLVMPMFAVAFIIESSHIFLTKCKYLAQMKTYTCSKFYFMLRHTNCIVFVAAYQIQYEMTRFL